MDVIKLREALTALRKLHWKTSRDAARAIGIGASTAAKIENVRGKARGYDPPIGTVAKFIEGLPGVKGQAPLTLSTFFQQFERRTDGDLQPDEGSRKDRRVPSGEAVYGPVVPSPIALDADQLVHLGRVIGRAIRAAARDRQTPAAYAGQPKRRARRPRNA